MEGRGGARRRDEQAREKRRKIVERLNSMEGGPNKEALKREELEREMGRQLAIEKGRRHPGV